MPKNLIYAQSGGATAVINVTARALIEAAGQQPAVFHKIYVAKQGITGILREEIFELKDFSKEELYSIENEPGAFFGTCRYKLRDPAEEQFRRIFEVFNQHDIGYFFYNGGNDSQDTTNRIANWCRQQGREVQCIGIPKTIDNDLALTDTCPGFGSVAKYISVAVNEVYADLRSISNSSTRVFILETMGRDAGWIAAAAGVTKQQDADPPHIILLPEVPFEQEKFLARVQFCVENYGCCLIVASEGLRDARGDYLHASRLTDSFGHQQLGGVAPQLAELVKRQWGYKYHWALPDYLQRAAKHLVSQTDYEQAAAVGRAAIQAALAGEREVMIAIKRLSNSPFQWTTETVPLQQIANRIKEVPANYLSADKFSLSEAGRAYVKPLILGEVYPEYYEGTLVRANLPKREIAQKLPEFQL